MCGTFYIDDDTAKEIEKTIRMVDEKLKMKRFTGVIRPTDMAAVISTDNNIMKLSPQKWGFPAFESSKVIINARAESVLERKMFRESVLHRRIIIPATGFYEWNNQKEKVSFTPSHQTNKQSNILYMAGFYNRFNGEDKFVILTTAANDSMKEVHDRMPLILEPQELESWLFEDKQLESFLNKIPPQLEKRQEYEQLNLTSFGIHN